MSDLYSATIGSGTLPHIGPLFPGTSGHFNGTFPVPGSREQLRTRDGTGVAIINPEDFSLHIGLGNQAIAVEGTALPLPAVPLEYRRCLVIHNNGPGILYIGKVGVTVSNGFPIAVQQKASFDIQGHGGMVIYGVSESTSDVRILELA